jgi:multidrug resistance efflux pump
MTNDSTQHDCGMRIKKTIAWFFNPHSAIRIPQFLGVLAVLALVVSSACQSQTGSEDGVDTRGIIIVNAPATGEIRRVLVREGMAVNEGAPIVEIGVRVEGPSATPSQTEDPRARAARNTQAAQAEIEAARADVIRKEVEVQRLTPLVAAGDAPQAQLDGARAEFERAQRRLQQAQSQAENAQSGLATARQQSQNSAIPAQTFSEQIVTARASSAGTLSAINARVGERVTTGQPLATIRAGKE